MEKKIWCKSFVDMCYFSNTVDKNKDKSIL